MVSVKCPNPYCNNIQSVQGFRPITFECEQCGMRGVWHKKYESGLIDWESTGEAVDFVTGCLAALSLGIFDEKILRNRAEELLRDVERASKDSRHL